MPTDASLVLAIGKVRNSLPKRTLRLGERGDTVQNYLYVAYLQAQSQSGDQAPIRCSFIRCAWARNSDSRELVL